MIDTETAGRTVTAACADWVGSAALVATTVTAPEGTVDGAVNRPDASMVPTVEFPPVIPFTVHVTAVFVVLLTVAVNC